MLKISKNYFVISSGSLYNRWNYVRDFKSLNEAEAAVAAAEEVNPARNMAGTCSMDYIEQELGQITTYLRSRLVKIPGIGVFRIPKHFKLSSKDDLVIFTTWVLDCFYECGDQSALNQSRNITECQELFRRYKVPSWRWDAEKYLFNEKDKYYKLA